MNVISILLNFFVFISDDMHTRCSVFKKFERENLRQMPGSCNVVLSGREKRNLLQTLLHSDG